MDLDDILKGITIHKVTEDEKKFDKPVALPFKDASKGWKTAGSDGMDIAILEEELKGVIFKRVPLPMPDFETYRTIPSYSYQVKNIRDLDVVVSMKFNANNLRVIPGAGFVLHNSTVKGIVKAGTSGNVCTCEPENKRAPVFDPFNADIMVYPAVQSVKEVPLDGCTLYIKSTYGDESVFDFDVYNGKDFEIEAEINLEGDFGKKTFIQRVKPKDKAYAGQVRSIKDINQSWKWKSAPGAIQPKIETRSFTSEAQGVFLTQNITNEAMNRNTIQINNTLDHAIHVEIDFVGPAQIDLMGHSRPIKARVPALSKQTVATVAFKGDMSVNWNWKGEH